MPNVQRDPSEVTLLYIECQVTSCLEQTWSVVLEKLLLMQLHEIAQI